MLAWLTTRRHRRILAQPFPREWDAIIDRNVAIAGRLSEADRARLRELVQIFIAEKHWEGCGGLELTEEMKVTIAAQACVLVLRRDLDLYKDVASILVYPSTVIAPARRPMVFEQPRVPISHGTTLLGEAHLGGPLILAWDAVLAGGREERAGNVVFHELAHKLDMADGAIDGTPPLPTKADRRAWADACSAAFRELRLRVGAGLPTLIDAYGATNEAEFFAVATETFFTYPDELRALHPALYRVLAGFYRIDPPPRPPEPEPEPVIGTLWFGATEASN